MQPHHVRNTLLILTLLALISGGGYVFVTMQKTSFKESVANTPQQLPQTVAEAKEEERNVTSIDGSKSLTMKMSSLADNLTYSFFAAESIEPLYTETFTGSNYSLGLPDNAWSPNEKYIFIEKSGGGVRDALVFNADGSFFPNNEQYLDVYSLYTQKNFPYTFSGATGWADNYLLIIQTVKSDGSRGPKFWFEVPSRTFIQLAR